MRNSQRCFGVKQIKPVINGLDAARIDVADIDGRQAAQPFCELVETRAFPIAYRVGFVDGVRIKKRRQIFQGANFLRSEEHTSELQSLMLTSYAVFCLKNNK